MREEGIRLNEIHHGILFLTFDDRIFADWRNTLPLFAAYGAHASFFVSDAIDDEAIEANTCITFFSHGIHENPNKSGMRNLGLDELPVVER